MKKLEKQAVIKRTVAHVKKAMSGESSGHDWWHIDRVYKNACKIAETEKHADLFVITLAALLHDIADYKLHGGDVDIGPKVARQWLERQKVDQEDREHIVSIIRDLSFKGAGTKSNMKTLEGKIVQDADRLDAIGAIGIARTFAYGGHKGRSIYDPKERPSFYKTFEQYKNNKAPTINHFFEKLLLLKALMNTKAAKRMAAQRHRVMVKFLKDFFEEVGDQNVPSRKIR